MSVKIRRLEIQNFKTFRSINLDFGDSILTVLDGPNGFGKTSFYDAVELLLTGRIRRYDDLVNTQANKRQKDQGCPFLFKGEGATGDLVIKGEFTIDDKVRVLIRKASRTNLEANKGISTNAFPLYELSEFDVESGLKLVTDEGDFISCVFGGKFRENFEFLNYIEQEENIYLLKSSDQERKEVVAHLFNTSEFRVKIDQIDEAKKNIGKLCNASAIRIKEELGSLIKQLESRITVVAPVPYTRLIKSQNHSWDLEEVAFSSSQLTEWLGDDGLLVRINQLVINQSDFLADRYNNRVWKSLWPKEEAINSLLRYGRFIDKQTVLKAQYDIDLAINSLISLFNGNVLESVRQDKLLIPSILANIVAEHFDVGEFNRAVSQIKTFDAEATMLTSALAGLMSSRSDFLSNFDLYANTKENGSPSECPTCGYDWKRSQILAEEIATQTKKLDDLAKAIGSDINKSIAALKSVFLTKIIVLLKLYKTEHPLDTVYIESLIELDEVQIQHLRDLKAAYAKEELDLNEFYCVEPSSAEKLRIDDLRKEVSARRKSVDVEKVKPFFRDLFLSIFGSDEATLNSCTEDSIKAKRAFLHWKYTIQQSTELEKKRIEYDKLCEQIDSANILKSKLSTLHDIYEKACQEYERDIINGIEILFHLYSGRIVQDCQGGRGLFINSDNNGIRFLENPGKIHDAVFSMSSGQLASLIISFTLALNKRYSTDRLLFIDDPVQTLDELNVVGLIDVLRNDFYDRQIFISTHEDEMSAYIRYKFSKYGLSSTRLNFKEIQFRQNLNEQ